MSITTNPRDVRVTARSATPRIRIGSNDAPDTYVPTGRGGSSNTFRITHRDRSMRHVVVIDPETGFTRDVRTGRDGATVGKLSEPTTAPNRDDRRGPTGRDRNGTHVITTSDAPTGPARRMSVNPRTGARSITDDNVNGGIRSPRAVRTVAMGDNRLPSVRMPERDTTTRTPRTPATRPEKSDRLADVRAFAAAHGIPIEKLADRRVVAAIRDVMASRAATAAYIGRR